MKGRLALALAEAAWMNFSLEMKLQDRLKEDNEICFRCTESV